MHIETKTSVLQEQGYNGAVRLGSRAFQYLTNLVMQTAIKVSCNDNATVLSKRLSESYGCRKFHATFQTVIAELKLHNINIAWRDGFGLMVGFRYWWTMVMCTHCFP